MQLSSSAKQVSSARVEEAVSAVLASAVSERHLNPHSIGFVRSNSCALNTRDTTYTVPDFFPVGGVAWPDALLALWKTVQYASFIGVFPALSRAWFTVDNKLVLWDYQGGREFCVYDEIPELISVVGDHTRPIEGTFQPHVTYILPVATADMLFLLGLCVVGEQDLASMKVVNLGYSCATSVVLTRIVCSSGRIFCAGADGEVYEVRYMRENTPLTPKIRLVSYGSWLSSTPVVGQLAATVAKAWGAWHGVMRCGLVDAAVDARDDLLIALSEQSAIALWRILPSGGLKHMLSLAHAPDRQQRSPSAAAQKDASPLIRLFVIDADAQGCRLLATALNGDQFRYRYIKSFDAVHVAELVLQAHTPSYLSVEKEVSVCYATSSAFLAAVSDPADDRGSDELLVATAPATVMAPHQNVHDVVTSFTGPTTRMVRVDAIAKVPSPAATLLSELCAQVSVAAATYVVVHRHGISLYSQARPVDTLYLILSSANADSRDSLLARFGAVYSATDYAAMLLQIAIGALRPVSHIPRSFSSDVSLAQSTDDGISLSVLGQRLSSGDSVEAQRKARELLRGLQLPGTQMSPNMGGEAEGQQVTVLMSPFATGLVAFLARSLSLLWDVPVSKIVQSNLVPVTTVLTKFIQYLDSLSIGAVSEQQRAIDLQHEWHLDKVLLVVPRGRSLHMDDIRRLQATMLYNCYELAHRALQGCALFLRAPWMPLHAEDISVTFSQTMRDASVAQRLGQYLSEVMLDTQSGTAAQDRVAAFTQLQQRCPYFFDGVSTQAYRLRSEMDALTGGGGLQSYSETQMLQWATEVGAKAASYWPSGALQSICEQLRSLKRENVAVEVLLHAAAQLDPSGAALNIYLAGGAQQPNDQLRFSTAYVAYQSKTQVLQLVVSTIEAAWLTHRSVADALLGGPRRSGTMWTVEPSDEYAHCFLFDWLCAPRDDVAMARTLRETLVSARSPFLAAYLRRNAAVLTEEYAHYLSRVVGDNKGAMQQCFVMAQSPLPDVPVADRLPYRLRCLREAVECAKKCQSDQQQQVEQQLRLLETQQRLYRIATDFIASGVTSLDARVEVDGQSVTERDVALQQIEFLSSYVASASELIAMGGMYPTLGGAEVQLDALLWSNVTEPGVYAVCIGRAYENERNSVESITRRLIDRYFHQTSCFPLAYLVRVLEARAFARAPAGSSSTVQLLVSLGVDAKVLFLAYESVLDKTDDIGVTCAEFEDAGVTRGYLVYAYATVLLRLADLARRGAVQQWLLTNALASVRNAIRLAANGVSSSEERTAAEQAEELLTKANSAAIGGLSLT